MDGPHLVSCVYAPPGVCLAARSDSCLADAISTALLHWDQSHCNMAGPKGRDRRAAIVPWTRLLTLVLIWSDEAGGRPWAYVACRLGAMPVELGQ
jgi:hypothetical protein